MTTTTVRITRKSRELLRKMADEDSASIQTVLENAISEYRRCRTLEAGNRAYAQLRAEPKEWAEEIAERKALEPTLGDRLEEASVQTRRDLVAGSEPGSRTRPSRKASLPGDLRPSVLFRSRGNAH